MNLQLLQNLYKTHKETALYGRYIFSQHLEPLIKKHSDNFLIETIGQSVLGENISVIKIGSGKNFGEYIPETDTITLRPSYKSVKEFLMTVLHEIKHALDTKRLGLKKYIKKYTQAGTMAQYDGLDPHDDNKWEEKAENFAKRELHKWL
mgnify:CR=1 FL=1